MNAYSGIGDIHTDEATLHVIGKLGEGVQIPKSHKTSAPPERDEAGPTAPGGVMDATLCSDECACLGTVMQGQRMVSRRRCQEGAFVNEEEQQEDEAIEEWHRRTTQESEREIRMHKKFIRDFNIKDCKTRQELSANLHNFN